MLFFFFQAEDGIRDLVRSRGLGDVYKRQELNLNLNTKRYDVDFFKNKFYLQGLTEVNSLYYLSLIHI